MSGWSQFRKVVFVDFEYSAPDGETPRPICVVARELGKLTSRCVWLDGFPQVPPPFSVDDETLYVAFYASAEIGCHIALGWPMPPCVLDLYAEFRCSTNGRRTSSGSGLLGALAYNGIDCLSFTEKESMRELALRGGPWTSEEKNQLLDYCESDVVALERLFDTMRKYIDIDRALLRGQFMVAAAEMEATGVPIDVCHFDKLREHWTPITRSVIDHVDLGFGVYEDGHFRTHRFETYLEKNGIAWPRDPAGRVLLDDATFKDMCLEQPKIRALRGVRRFRSQMRPPALTVGADGRNRCLLSAFRSQTGRNQPSNSKFIFGAPSWMRGLIQPSPGHGVAYVDWAQQEFGIAAALSCDEAMLEAYRSGDPYLALAVQAGAAPHGATKASHCDVRERFKQCVLGVQYGMRELTLAKRIGASPAHARELLDHHRRTYPTFWRWSEAAVDNAMLHGVIRATYGWTLHTASWTKWRSLANFPMQANGAEMLRIACILATRRGVRVCAPVHDAILIEAPKAELDGAITEARRALADASSAVLDGFELRTEVRSLHHPERLLEPRGQMMWKLVLRVLSDVEDQSVGTKKLLHEGNSGVVGVPTRSLLSTSSSQSLDVVP